MFSYFLMFNIHRPIGSGRLDPVSFFKSSICPSFLSSLFLYSFLPIPQWGGLPLPITLPWNAPLESMKQKKKKEGKWKIYQRREGKERRKKKEELEMKTEEK